MKGYSLLGVATDEPGGCLKLMQSYEKKGKYKNI